MPAADILQARETAEFQRLMAFQAARARVHYDKAMQALPETDRRAQRPGLIMAAIYRTVLDEIERDGFRVLTRRHVARRSGSSGSRGAAWISA